MVSILMSNGKNFVSEHFMSIIVKFTELHFDSATFILYPYEPFFLSNQVLFLWPFSRNFKIGWGLWVRNIYIQIYFNMLTAPRLTCTSIKQNKVLWQWDRANLFSQVTKPCFFDRSHIIAKFWVWSIHIQMYFNMYIVIQVKKNYVEML